MADMKKPKSGGKPKKIEFEGSPGGPYTPGAKKEQERRRKEVEELMKKKRAQRDEAVIKRQMSRKDI